MISLCLNVFWSFALIHLDKRGNYKSSLNSSLVSGGEWAYQAEWCSWRSGAGRAAGVRGALATPLCVSQWGQSQGFHLPQWHQGEFSVTQNRFLWCLSSQNNTDVILQIFISVIVFSFYSSCYCCVCLLSQVLTVTSLALPMSEVFTVQWALWCTELYYPGPFGSFGLFTTADKCQLTFPQAVLTIPGLKLHIALALPLCPNQKFICCC